MPRFCKQGNTAFLPSGIPLTQSIGPGPLCSCCSRTTTVNNSASCAVRTGPMMSVYSVVLGPPSLTCQGNTFPSAWNPKLHRSGISASDNLTTQSKSLRSDDAQERCYDHSAAGMCDGRSLPHTTTDVKPLFVPACQLDGRLYACVKVSKQLHDLWIHPFGSTPYAGKTRQSASLGMKSYAFRTHILNRELS